MGELARWARLYRRSLGTHIRATLEYESDFWLIVLAAVLTQLSGIVFLAAVFARVPEIQGWRLPEVVVIFALMNLAGGIGSLFFEGSWYLPWAVVMGELDYFLVRPWPPVFQVMSARVGLHGGGAIVTATLLLGWALPRADLTWSPLTGLVAVALVVSGVLVKLAITLASATLAFWAPGGSFMFPSALHEVGNLAQYPITVYSLGVRVALSLVVPFAFVGFYPAAALLDPAGSPLATTFGLLTPVVAVYCVGLAGWLMRIGLRRYESAGN